MAKVMFSGGVLNHEPTIFKGLSAYDCARQTLKSRSVVELVLDLIECYLAMLCLRVEVNITINLSGYFNVTMKFSRGIVL